MGLWGAVKYALNSTLGTSGFKSLDTIISTTGQNTINQLTTEINNLTHGKDGINITNFAYAAISSTTKTTYDLIDISDSNGGDIYYIGLTSNGDNGNVMSSNADLTITIDGETVYTKTYNGRYAKFIGTRDFLIPIATSETTTTLKPIVYHGDISWTQTVYTGNTNIMTFNSPYNNYGAPIFELLPKPLHFNESIKITYQGAAYNNSTTLHASVLYSLK